MQVYTKVDESDVGRIQVGRPVMFKVDAFPKQVFTGNVSQIRMNPTVVQNVVTYDAVIEFANPDMKLFPGMTAYVTIPVASADNVMKIPNAALHYRPALSPEEIHALYKQHGIEVAGSRGGADAKGGDVDPAMAVVWKRIGGDVEPVQVELGITDHAFTAATRVLSGGLKEGDELVTRAIQAKSTAPGGARR